MPTKPQILGFSESKWFDEGFKTAIPYAISDSETISVFDTLHLLAAKIEAFQERGKEDLFASRDVEDIATILDGNTRVWNELASGTPVARFVNKWLRALDDAEAADALAGHVGGYDRATLLLDRIDGLPDDSAVADSSLAPDMGMGSASENACGEGEALDPSID
jgi:hypothetical protein